MKWHSEISSSKGINRTDGLQFFKDIFVVCVCGPFFKKYLLNI